MKTELNARNIGGDLYKQGCVLDDIKAANESFLVMIQYLLGTNTEEYGQAQEKSKDYFVLNDQYVKEEEVKELKGHTCGSIPPADHTKVNNIKRLKTSWENYLGGNILLTPCKFSFPSITLPKYDVNVVLW